MPGVALSLFGLAPARTGLALARAARASGLPGCANSRILPMPAGVDSAELVGTTASPPPAATARAPVWLAEAPATDRAVIDARATLRNVKGPSLSLNKTTYGRLGTPRQLLGRNDEFHERITTLSLDVEPPFPVVPASCLAQTRVARRGKTRILRRKSRAWTLGIEQSRRGDSNPGPLRYESLKKALALLCRGTPGDLSFAQITSDLGSSGHCSGPGSDPRRGKQWPQSSREPRHGRRRACYACASWAVHSGHRRNLPPATIGGRILPGPDMSIYTRRLRSRSVDVVDHDVNRRLAARARRIGIRP